MKDYAGDKEEGKGERGREGLSLVGRWEENHLVEGRITGEERDSLVLIQHGHFLQCIQSQMKN